MAKIDYQKYALPDIEMYAGNTDSWDFPLYDADMKRYLYTDVTAYTYKLIIKDYGYTHRPNGSTYFTLVKTGLLSVEDDGVSAYVHFDFEKADTNDRYGKFTYQMEATGAGKFFSAQGNLYITKNINQ